MESRGKGRGKAVKEEEDEEKSLSKLLMRMMENYSDSVIPPISEFSPIPRAAIVEKGSSSRKRSRSSKPRGGESLQKERERREKMTEMFSVLQSIVPNVFNKATREKIVSSAIDYIQILEKERVRLEELKKSSSSSPATSTRPALCHCTNRRFCISIAVSSAMAFFEIHSPVRRHGAVTEIIGVFAKNNAEVLAANVAVNERQLRLTVTALMAGNGSEIAEKIKRDILLL